MEQEAIRERNTSIEPKWRDDCGWGRPNSEHAGVHFKTFIGTSLRILEAHARRRDPSLQACRRAGQAGGADGTDMDDFSTSQLACDVEEYLGRVRAALGGELDDDLCKQYVAFYRNARVPGRQCTELEYRSFLGVFQEILRRVEP